MKKFYLAVILTFISINNASDAADTIITIIGLDTSSSSGSVIINTPNLGKTSLPVGQPDVEISMNSDNPTSSIIICTKCDKCDTFENDLNNITNLKNLPDAIKNSTSASDVYNAVKTALTDVANTLVAKCCTNCKVGPKDDPYNINKAASCSTEQTTTSKFLTDIQTATKDIADKATALQSQSTSNSTLNTANEKAITCIKTDFQEDSDYSNPDEACAANNDNKPCQTALDYINADNNDTNIWNFNCDGQIKALAAAMSNSTASSDFINAQANLAGIINNFINDAAIQANITSDQVVQRLKGYSSKCSNYTNATSIFYGNTTTEIATYNLSYDWNGSSFNKYPYQTKGLVLADKNGEALKDKDGKVIPVKVDDLLYTSCLIINYIQDVNEFQVQRCKQILTSENYVQFVKNHREQVASAQQAVNDAWDGWNKAAGILGTVGMLAFFLPMIIEKVNSVKAEKANALRAQKELEAKNEGFKNAADKEFADKNGMNATELSDYRSLQGEGYKFQDVKEFRSFETQGGKDTFKSTEAWSKFKELPKPIQEKLTKSHIDSLKSGSKGKSAINKLIDGSAEAGMTHEEFNQLQESFEGLSSDVKANIKSVKIYNDKTYVLEGGEWKALETNADGSKLNDVDKTLQDTLNEDGVGKEVSLENLSDPVRGEA